MERNFEICRELSGRIYEDSLDENILGWTYICCEEHLKEVQDGKKPHKVINLACAAYKKANEIVIAYRGTDGILDVITDANFIVKKIPPSSILAKNFYLKIKKLNPDCKIWLTGHSLGGAYAQIISSRAIRDSNLCNAITFNAPGVGYALTKKERETHKKTLLEKISNYVIMNDWIGNSREHAGSTYYIQPYPLNVPKPYNPKKNETPHNCIKFYSTETNGAHFCCPKGWNVKHAGALWVFDVNESSIAEKAARKVVDTKVNRFHLQEAIEIIKTLQDKGELKLLNSFAFKAFGKKYELKAN